MTSGITGVSESESEFWGGQILDTEFCPSVIAIDTGLLKVL